MTRRFKVVFDRDASADLASIRDHIREARGQEFADQFLERIIRDCESFATVPHRGTKRDTIHPGLRTVGGRRTVTSAFEVRDNLEQVVILGVFYRGRDVLSVLQARTK